MSARPRPTPLRAAAFTAVCAAMLLLGQPVVAQAAPGQAGAAAGRGQGPALERLDRGLVATVVPEGVFLSWRLLRPEATGATATGLTGPDFRVYRDGALVATVSGRTNHVDAGGTAASSYRVVPVVGGRERGRIGETTPLAQPYLNIPLQKPADGVTPVGEAYTYTAGDASVGDVDGDGAYEYIVKWNPSNAKDVSLRGYTGPVYLDTYETDGTLRHRIDLGVNIRAGEHYTQFMVYDFDGDGRAEIMLKTAPGTRTVAADGSQRFITLPREDVRAGVTHADDYRLSAADYRLHLVEMFRGWSQRPEVVNGSWPATLEQAWGIEPRYAYPLSEADAGALADHFLDVYAPSRNARNLLRQFEGFIIEGPEYLTVFEGASGRELQTIRYEPGRVDDGLLWGDYAFPRIEPGNRVDRFNAGVAYLDGRRPSAIFARGYYSRSALVAYNWDGRRLRQKWSVDSGFVPMDNPFNAVPLPHGPDGTDPEYGSLANQGFHSLSAADVDGDGRQEIIYGSATIDDDGDLLYSSTGTRPDGTVGKLGHGDSMHVTDIDPARPGLEMYTVHENVTAPYGYVLRDAATGEAIYGQFAGRDVGRAMVGDVLPEHPGLETWSIGMRTAAGVDLGTRIPGTDQSIRWAGDMTTQIISRVATVPTISDWRRGPLLTATGTATSNGIKNVSLVADVIGDWREEMVVGTVDGSALRVYTTTETSEHMLYTLMHDVQYRPEVARQNTTYNQPSYTSFYLASDMDFTKVPLPRGFRR
ncbi:MAG TPA: rhamnogalacturonan lyase [Micromonosporaceae bacterium]|nr:rhamnogalacturonan lyase [Micromonosporaceae bacterium]